MEVKNRLGLALGSGAARGWAHIGVLRELLKKGIEPDIVCGSSIGAFIGAAYVTGHFDELERWVCKLNRRNILRLLDFRLFGGGFVSGEKQKQLIRDHFGDINIEALDKRFIAIATNLKTGLEIWFRDGSLIDAVHASLALPGLFAPVQSNGRWLVDGGLVNPVPVSACRALGAETVIAVNLNSDILGKHLREVKPGNNEKNPAPEATSGINNFFDQLKENLIGDRDSLISKLWARQEDVPGVLDVLLSSINIMQDRITRSRLAGDPPDLLLEPKLKDIALMEFDKGQEAIEEGRLCVQRMSQSIDGVLYSSR